MQPGDCRCRLDTMENGERRLKVGGWKLETVCRLETGNWTLVSLVVSKTHCFEFSPLTLLKND